MQPYVTVKCSGGVQYKLDGVGRLCPSSGPTSTLITLRPRPCRGTQIPSVLPEGVEKVLNTYEEEQGVGSSVLGTSVIE